MASLLLSIAILFCSQAFGAKILIATVAQVKNHVITSREVEIHQELDRIFGKRFEKLSDEDPEEQVIREWLLFYEASTFYNSPVNASQSRKLFNLAKQRLANSKKWRRLSVTEKELNEKVKRRLEAERLYQFKKKASVLPVSQSEIEVEYTQNRIRYGNQSFEEAKDKIRQAKVDANLNRRMEQWFQVLSQKYKVQRFSKFNRL